MIDLIVMRLFIDLLYEFKTSHLGVCELKIN
jgi:hypothetical protein